MKDIEKKLPPKIFQRVHRSFIVNLDKIESIVGGNVVMQDFNKEISVGGNYRDELAERINVL
jgi:DNA-binding LytR/AlgR family response regulator